MVYGASHNAGQLLGETSLWRARVLCRTVREEKQITLWWVDNGEETPRWAARGIDPPRPFRAIILRALWRLLKMKVIYRTWSAVLSSQEVPEEVTLLRPSLNAQVRHTLIPSFAPFASTYTFMSRYIPAMRKRPLRVVYNASYHAEQLGDISPPRPLCSVMKRSKASSCVINCLHYATSIIIDFQ
jgi:hypothetical protein